MMPFGTARIYAVLLLSLTAAMAAGKEKSATPAIDPHWRDDACKSCHTTASPSPRNPALRHKGSDRLCNTCHDPANQHAYIHPSDVAPGTGMRQRMPPAYRQAMKNGKIVCTTCHDLPAQCLDERRREQHANPMFLRGAPFTHRSDPCYLCHDARAYARINPHDQITNSGQVRKATCILCHNEVENLQTAAKVEGVGFNIEHDLVTMCTGCHPWIPHPGGKFMFTESFNDRKDPDHLVVPPKRMRTRMQRMAVKNDIILPLDPTTGKVYCATCHNPHERGLFKNSAMAKGTDADKHLRMKNLCINCHDK